MSEKKRGHILVHFVKKYAKIIEDKKTDSNMNKLKNDTWKKMEVEFNSSCMDNRRDAITLKKKYENIKKKTKKKIADDKCFNKGTGGGSLKEEIFTEVDRDVEEILGERAHGLPTRFGGDAHQEEIITVITEQTDEQSDEEMTAVPEYNSQHVSFLTDTYDGGKYMDDNTIYDEGPSCSYSNKTPSTVISGKLTDENTTSQVVQWDGGKFIPDDTEPEIFLTKKKEETNLKSKILSPGKHKKSRDEYASLFSKVTQWTGSKSALEAEKLTLLREEHAAKIKMLQKKNEAEIAAINKESDATVKKIENEMQVQIEGIKEQNKIKKDILLLERQKVLKEISNLK